MSKISLAGNASGTGTFTIASPNGNTDRTINLPDSNGTILTTATAGVPVNGPAFSASINSFSVASNTHTLAPMSLEEFDTAGNYNSTNATVGGIPAYAFKPSVAGYYAINFGVQYAGVAYSSYFVASIRKNGAFLKESVNTASASYIWTYGAYVIYLDGVSDSVQLYAYQQQGTTQSMQAIMSAALIRSAT